MAWKVPERRLLMRGLLCECGDHAWSVLNKGFVTLVSPEDAPLLRKHVMVAFNSPTISRTFYVTFKVKAKTMWLHRVIKKVRTRRVDHRNRNGLDNRRPNLRVASNPQNQANRAKIMGSRWPYKGVRERNGSWTAHIGVKKQQIHLGSFKTAEDAAMAYDRAAKKYYGRFANLNFPEGRK